MKTHTPAQWDRINAFIKKAKAEKRVPESYWAHDLCEINLTGWEGFANIKAEFMSINPIVQLNYLITREIPEIRPSKSMRDCASRALIEIAKLGQVKRGQGVIKDLGADVNYLDKEGKTPLCYAIRRKRLGMAEMLLEHGAKTQWNDNEFYDAMNFACAHGPDMAIPLLIKYGADVNKPQKIKDWNRWHLGYKPLHVYPLVVAICHNRAKTCQILLDHGAKLDLPITSKKTIRNFAENNFDEMPPEMKTLFAPILNKQITEPQKITSHPAVFPELPAPQNERV